MDLPKTRALCAAPADRLHSKGLSTFDPISIITILTTLLPLLFNLCKKPNPTPEAQQKAAKASYRKNKNPPYTKRAMRIATSRAKWAAKQESIDLTDGQAEETAVETMDEIRLATKETFAGVFKELKSNQTEIKELAAQAAPDLDDGE